MWARRTAASSNDKLLGKAKLNAISSFTTDEIKVDQWGKEGPGVERGQARQRIMYACITFQDLGRQVCRA